MAARLPEPVKASAEERELLIRWVRMCRAGAMDEAADRLATWGQAKYDAGYVDGDREGFEGGYSAGVYDGRREAEGRP